MGLSETDVKTIDKVRYILSTQFFSFCFKAQRSLNLMYHRYTKYLLGWKRASDTSLNQKFLLGQMKECVRIFSTRNLHLSDLSDGQDLDATVAKQ